MNGVVYFVAKFILSQMPRLVNILVWLFLFPLLLGAQSVSFNQLFTDQGLPENTGHTIIEDQQGYIWIGTQNGLVRYDGYEFKTFKYQAKDTNSLRSNRIESLFEDREGNIWVNTKEGVHRLNREKEIFEHYFPKKKGVPTNWLTYNIVQTNDGHIWCSSHFGVLEIKDWATRDVSFHAVGNEQKHTHHWVYYNAKEDELWLGRNDTLYKKEGEVFVPKAQVNSKLFVVASFHDTLLMGTSDGMFYVSEDFTVKPYPGLESIHANAILSLKEDQLGRLWIGTSNGLFIWNGHYLRHITQKEGLSNDLVLCWYEDSQGLIWIGTGHGVNIYDPLHEQITRVGQQDSIPFQLPNKNIKTIRQMADGTVWIGTTAGLVVVDGVNNASIARNVTTYTSATTPSLIDDHIRAIEQDEKGNIWLGTQKGYLFHYQKEQDYFERIPKYDASRILRGIISIGNKLWLGSDASVYCYDVENKTYDSLSWLPEFGVVQMETYRGEIWVGGFDSLFVINPKTKKYRSYNVEKKLSNTLFTDLLATDSCLWFSTFGGGFYKYNPIEDSFYNYTEEQGLINNNVWSVNADERGRLWLSTDNGVSVFEPQNERFINLKKEDGLNFNDFNMGAHAHLSNGQLLLGNPEGLNILSPDHFETNPFVPRVAFTDVKINYESVKIFIENHQTLELYPGDKTLSFSFSGLNYRNPELNRYAYQLTGYNNEWVYTDALHRTATYTDLPPGDYTFKVKAANNHGVWGDEVATMEVVVFPPFYKTWWFKTLAILLIVGTAGGSVYWYNRRKYLKTIQNLQFKQKVQDERERISRDLHDHVGAHLTKVVTDLDLLSLQLERKPVEENLNKIEGTRSYTQSTIQLLRDTIWAINQDQYNVEEFAQKIEAFLNKYLAGTISFEVIKNIKGQKQLSPNEVLNLLRIVQEATQNMVKYAQAMRYQITINYDKHLTLEILDNGVGMEVTASSSQGNYGLYNMKKRAADIGARFTISSEKGKGVKLFLQL